MAYPCFTADKSYPITKTEVFEKDHIEWKVPVALHDFYKKLLHLHSTHPALRTADLMWVQTHHLHTSADQEIFPLFAKMDSMKCW
jgi:hypothetical protein